MYNMCSGRTLALLLLSVTDRLLSFRSASRNLAGRSLLFVWREESDYDGSTLCTPLSYLVLTFSPNTSVPSDVCCCDL
jgi:hypothetical protein